jgi:hypothetical protein
MFRIRLISWAQHRRKLLRLLHVPDLGRQIVAAQRHAEQEAHPGHDPVAVADAGAALDEVQRRTSSAVAVSGERLSQAANRLQL